MLSLTNVSPPSVKVGLPYTLTNLKQNKQMKFKNKGVVITPYRELQI